MERELEQLASLLRQVAHDAGHALLGRRDADALRFCIDQYNRVRERLGTLDAGYTALFGPMPEDAHPGDVRIVSRALSLYVREKLRQARARRDVHTGSFAVLFPLRLVF